ncbi:hypothetical protein JCM10212_004132 [Sporobolomyces blumeae]
MTWSRLVRFIAEEDGKTYYGDVVESGDVGLSYSQGKRLTARPIHLDSRDRSPLSSTFGTTPDASRPLTVRKLLAPLDPTLVTTIRGLGLQYAPPTRDGEPAAEKAKPPPVLSLFLKPNTAIAGPGSDIVIPSSAKGEKNDYEVELCVVIGDEDVPPNTDEREIMKYVAGYCVVNDVTSRGLSGKGGAGQWGMGKGYDSWCPIGPCIVHPSVLADPGSLEFSTRLNDKVVQKGNTRDLLVPVPKLLATLSKGTTLSRRSLVLTGSPVAIGRKAPGDESSESPFVKDGDVVTCWVEGIGSLINTIREESPDQALTRVYKAKL